MEESNEYKVVKVNVVITGMENYIEAVKNVEDACRNLRNACAELEYIFQEKYGVKMPPSKDGGEEIRKLH